MRLSLYAHPWDLRDLAAHGGLQRLRDLGFGEVALAAAYHAGRWLTPWSSTGMVRHLQDGTVHFRPGAGYADLRPLASSEVGPDRSPLQELCAAAPAAGLQVRAWTVFFHNTRLGELHPGSCVHNALGDRYPYALCPARPEVRDYGLALLGDLAGHGDLHAIELEAFGWMGFQHSSHHDKRSFALDPVTDWLLSVCFCEVCSDGGAGPLRERFRDLLRQRLGDGDAMVPLPRQDGAEVGRWLRDSLGAEAVGRLLQFRITTQLELLQAARAAVPPAIQLAAQIKPASLFTGSQLPLPPELAGAGGADEVVLTCYGMGPDAIARELASLGEGPQEGPARRLALWPKAPEFTADDDLRRVRDVAQAHGVDALAIYHLGLLPWRTLERVARVLTS